MKWEILAPIIAYIVQFAMFKCTICNKLVPRLQEVCTIFNAPY